MAYVTLTQLRALPDLSDTTSYSDDLLTAGIAYAGDLIDRYCGCAFELRQFIGNAVGTAGNTLRVENVVGVLSILGATTRSGEQVDVTGWTVDPFWQFIRTTGQVYGNIAVVGTCCVTPDGVPAEIQWAAQTIAHHYATDLYSRVPDRALSMTNDFGMTMLAQAGGVGRPTAFPDVNAVLNRWRVGSAIVS